MKAGDALDGADGLDPDVCEELGRLVDGLVTREQLTLASLHCRIVGRGWYRRLPISLVDDAQALEGEPRLEVLDRAGVRHDQLARGRRWRPPCDGPSSRLEAVDDARRPDR